MVRIRVTLQSIALAAACLGLGGLAHAQIATAAAAGAVAVAPHLVAAAPALLTGAISSASAHAGTAVLAKLASPAALSNGLKLPAGSQLLGKVTQVQPLKGNKGTSSLNMLFDKVKLPSGQEQSITPSMLHSIGNGSPRQDQRQQSETSANASASASSGNNGGLLGGVVGGVTNTVTGTVGGVANATGQLLGAVTSLPGVLLQSNGTLAAQGRNVEVPAGTQITVQTSTQVSAQ